MRYCPGCGEEVRGDWGHCPDCGEDLSTRTRDSASEESPYPTGRKITLGGLGLVAIGAFLPWVSASVLGTTDSVIGVNTLGVVTLILAALGGLGVLLSWSTGTQTLTLLAAVVIAGVAACGITNPRRLVEVRVSGLGEGLIQPASGLYATLLGGVLVVIASGYAITNENQPAGDDDEEPGFFTLYWLPGFSE